MPKPPYFSQTYEFSCVPTCLKMVLAVLNVDKSEAELRSLCDCDETRHISFKGSQSGGRMWS